MAGSVDKSNVPNNARFIGRKTGKPRSISPASYTAFSYIHAEISHKDTTFKGDSTIGRFNLTHTKYNLKEFAAIFKIKPDTARKWRKKGLIPGAHRVGRDWLVPEWAVEKMSQKHGLPTGGRIK